MKIYIVKHYWENGKNATWQKHDNIDNELFEYLKNNYHKFVESRKSNDKFKTYNIHLCYEDKKDIYNRDITNITFFISKNKIPLDICNKDYNNLEKNNKEKKYIFIAVAIFLLLLVLFFSNFNNKQKGGTTKIVKETTKQDYTAFINNWNKFVQDITNKKEFLLNRESNEKLIEQLNNFKKPFYYSKDEIEKKLSGLEYSNAKKYKKFLELNKSDKNITFSISMDHSKIKENLKTLTQTKETDLAKIVKEVLMMNDKDIFLKEMDK